MMFVLLCTKCHPSHAFSVSIYMSKATHNATPGFISSFFKLLEQFVYTSPIVSVTFCFVLHYFFHVSFLVDRGLWKQKPGPLIVLFLSPYCIQCLAWDKHLRLGSGMPWWLRVALESDCHVWVFLSLSHTSCVILSKLFNFCFLASLSVK